MKKVIFIIMALIFPIIANAVTYNDFSALKNTTFDNKFSHSTIFYTDKTEVRVIKSLGTEIYTDFEGKKLYGFETTRNELKSIDNPEYIVLITNCAIDEDNELVDVVVKINNFDVLNIYHGSNQVTSSDDSAKIKFRFLRYQSFEDQTKPNTRGYMLDIANGAPIIFILNTNYVTYNFTVTYYKNGTYSYKNGVEKGTKANITSINSVYGDIDYKIYTGYSAKKTDNSAPIFNGDEGIAPLNTNSTIYYDKKLDTGAVTNFTVNDYTTRGFDQVFEPVSDKMTDEKKQDYFNGLNTLFYHRLVEEDNGIKIAQRKYGYYNNEEHTAVFETSEKCTDIWGNESGMCGSGVINVDAWWYQTSAFISTSNVTDASYSFVFDGPDCGIATTFSSPSAYKYTSPEIEASAKKIDSNSTVTFNTTQYIPNNYYSKELSLFKGFNGYNTNYLLKTLYLENKVSDGLKILKDKITVTNNFGEDLTSLFTIIVDGQTAKAVAKSSSLENPVLYNSIISLNVPVKLSDTTITSATGQGFTKLSSTNSDLGSITANKTNVVNLTVISDGKAIDDSEKAIDVNELPNDKDNKKGIIGPIDTGVGIGVALLATGAISAVAIRVYSNKKKKFERI